ncbi:hypothetical protein PAESOLCIP111_06257 [Paenibacillus solanacearum]|uniref:Sialate O-acetylesterase domain-containing protein n=1 Tax=Paenibacillus solanacearum TaxID=2048548 RepID=A0A916NLN7_9BACL|nr:hypothetical protein PAESOLCIP111_06257 [Paenibacillus solanacearum]
MITAQLIEPIAQRVYQRNEKSVSDISIEVVLSDPVTGRLEARLSSECSPTPWRYIGEVNGTSFKGTLPDVPVGQHLLDVRISFDSKTITLTADPVFVGDLWILAGQSNMEGCGKNIDLEMPVTGVSCFYMGDTWDIAREPLCWLQESIDPVNWNVPEEEREQAIRTVRQERSNGAGLSLTFAKKILQHTGVPIGLIMCAHGGTSMSQWDPGLIGEEGRSFYGAMIRKVRKLGGRVKGCLWYQGEADANEKAAPDYLERTIRWVNSLRSDLSSPELPFIYAQLSVFHINGDGKWWNRIQQDQFELESKIKHAAMVPTIDATLSDAIHLDARSLKEVGRRMASAALRLTYGIHEAESGPRPADFAWNTDRTELRISLSGINGELAQVEQVYGILMISGGVKQWLSASIGEDRQHIVICFQEPVPVGSKLLHGVGYNPTVNVKDARSIPLPVFGPVDV